MKKTLRTVLVALATLGTISLAFPANQLAGSSKAAVAACQNAQCDGVKRCEYSPDHGCCMSITGTECNTTQCIMMPDGCPD